MTRPIGALSSSLMMTGRWLAVWRRPRWSWWQGSTPCKHCRTRHISWSWNRPTNLGVPLVLSPSGRLMSGRVLSIVGPMSSLTVCTPRPTAVRPVRAGPFHRRNHGLLFRGPRTCGFCLGSFGLGRPVDAGTLGEELKRIVRSMDFYGVVHGITFAGFLRRFRRSGSLASCLLSVGLGLSSPRLRQPILANETGTVLSTKRLPFIQAALLAAKMVVVSSSEMRTPGKLGLRFSWRRPVTWSLRHFVRASMLDKDVNKRFHTLPTCPNFNLSAADKLHRKPQLSSTFVFYKHLGRPLVQCVNWTHVRSRARRKSKWRLANVVLCAGVAAHGPWRGLNFIVWNFAWDRLASRLYAATATTFLMKKLFIIYHMVPL